MAAAVERLPAGDSQAEAAARMDALREQLAQLLYGTELPLVSALLLGMLGALSPCQLTTNAAAIAFVSRHVAQGRVMAAAAAYLAGKAMVYTILGVILIAIGWRVALESVPLVIVMRKLLGPSLIVAGIVLVGLIRFRFSVGQGLSDWLQRRAPGEGVRGSFFLGSAFALVFCPTLFVLFFTLLVPLAIVSRGGLLYPAVFALGTTLPVIVFSLVAGLAATRLPESLRGARRWGALLQKGAGLVFVGVGIREVMLYGLA